MVGTVSPDTTVTLLDAVVALVEELEAVECTATELLNKLQGVADELPQDVTRLGRALTGLASQLEARSIVLERVKTSQGRVIKLLRR